MHTALNGNRKKIYFRDGRRLWFHSWISGLVISIIAFLIFKISPVGPFRFLFYIFCLAAALFYATGLGSLIFSRIRLLEFDQKEIFLYTGIFGLSKLIKLEWNDVESISVETRDIKSKMVVPLGFVTTIGVAQQVLIIEIKKVLSEEKLKMFKDPKRRLVTRGIVFDESKSEIWLKERPKGGFSSLLNSMSRIQKIKII